MSFKLIDQLLKSGAVDSFTGQGRAAGGTSQPTTSSADSLVSSLSGMLSGRGGAALAGGALGLLLGSKKGRKLGGKVLTYGGLAALGVVAYKAYGNWQQRQADGRLHPGAVQAEPQTIDRLPPPQAEEHGRAILSAVIAAAKADGHIDARETALIDQEVAKFTRDQAFLQWVDNELKSPLEPARIAAQASTPELAAEIYLASLLVVDEESFMERSYLEELARQLGLAPDLVQELKAQALQAEQLCQ
ncbi:tellurite resistance TerB family protein [Aliiglaciecola sp. CAU 1673]|uniref:tellurite resistance TerB family protein n=1 Tax=Aliiglaciecola sp. CAU 1673 TaxID=3032595 RepID=UPI0023DC5B0D|nr:tellurite resistance TerB family protein [Aliiglaciecola sp. CAU 1673]MDF2180142.1 tellurite resistance TerB family protein [Aliiglaciecola sp. CAU 1673]